MPADADHSEDITTEETVWLNVMEHDDLTKCLDTCIDRWQNAGPEACKKMFALFTITGIFLAVCQHGHVLVICDMICSSELYVISKLNSFCYTFHWHVLEWSTPLQLSSSYMMNLDLTYVLVMTSCALSGRPCYEAPLELTLLPFVSVALYWHSMVMHTIEVVRCTGSLCMLKVSV